MHHTVDIKSINWWFWFVTLILIAAALPGWIQGYYLVMEISFLQLFYFLIKEKSIMAFPTQIRLVYFAVSLFGFWPAARFYVYLLLLVGTFMVVFLGRCSIAAILKHMPWNRNREVRLN